MALDALERTLRLEFLQHDRRAAARLNGEIELEWRRVIERRRRQIDNTLVESIELA